MTQHIFLALAIHNHQPVGNFPWVFETAYRLAYEPMIAALERHPGVRLALHYTGPLRDWLLENRPELLQRITRLVARGQVEVMTGGYYEPILVALPDADKRGQIRKLSQAVQEDFGYTPTGAWLAERVWEPHLPKPLAEAGVEYTIVDDTHFKYVGLGDEDLFGYYVTEEQGYVLKIFGTSKHLRYTIPWAPVEEVIAWLREQADESGRKVAVMGDDGEKFGLWPGTHEHCWGNGNWMEHFFTALEENQDWLETIPPGEYARRFPALGRVYLPAASYDEMTEWALPARMSWQITRLKHQLAGENRQDVLRFVKGGFWRYFMVKYPEVNTMHKKMLHVSAKVHALPDSPERAKALDHLWAGQCNCPYWHGVFGGIYLFHIRVANFQHLIAAEDIADRVHRGSKPWVNWQVTDFDKDTAPEVLLESDVQNLYFKPAVGGALFEWDWRAKRYNLLNNLTRRPEGYHEDLRRAGERGELVVTGSSEELETIHTTRVRVKEPDLHKKLFYDWYRRSSLIDHFLHPDTTLESFAHCQYGELGDFVNQPYTYHVTERDGRLELVLCRDGHVWCGEIFAPLRVEKRVVLQAGSGEVTVTYALTNTGEQEVSGRFGVECNWGLLGGDGPGAYISSPRFSPARLNSLGEHSEIEETSLTVEHLGISITLRTSRPATLWHFPIETISNSEAGFERGYQGTCLLLHWPVVLLPGNSWDTVLRFLLR